MYLANLGLCSMSQWVFLRDMDILRTVIHFPQEHIRLPWLLRI
jgi:hypothetical protein